MHIQSSLFSSFVDTKQMNSRPIQAETALVGTAQSDRFSNSPVQLQFASLVDQRSRKVSVGTLPPKFNYNRPVVSPRFLGKDAEHYADLKSQMSDPSISRNIKTQPLTGLVDHVSIQGHSDTFEALGAKTIDTTHGPKSVDVLSFQRKHFVPRIVGGGQVYHPFAMSAGELIDLVKKPGDKEPTIGKTYVIMSGGFFNLNNRVSKEHPDYTPIGRLVVDNKEQPFLAPPTPYEKDYASIKFDDSELTCAPILFKDGKTQFPASKLEEPQYQFQDPYIYGELKHAEHPNPRGAHSAPGKDDPEGIVRLIASFPPTKARGKLGTGFTMPQWADLIRSVTVPGNIPEKAYALNLDGGNAVRFIVIQDGKIIFKKGFSETPVCANFIVYTHQDDLGDDKHSGKKGPVTTFA